MEKIKNTPLNKELFFGIYLNQDVLHDGNKVDTLKKSWNWRHKDFKLQLKHLKNITDEELREIFILSLENEIDRDETCITIKGEYFRIIITILNNYLGNGYSTIRLGYGDITIIDDITFRPLPNATSRYLTIYDYLRSKGYVLPWRGLSVEDMLEYGWIIL